MSRHESERFNDAVLQRLFSQINAALSRRAVANPTFLGTDRAGGVPPTPSGLTKIEGPGTVTIAWSQVSIADLLYYQVQVSADPAFVANVFTDQAGANGRYTYFGGTAGVTYYLRVRTVNGDGNASGWSGALNSQTGQVTAAGIADGAVGTTKIAALAASQRYLFQQFSGFTALTTNGATESYGPVTVTVEDANVVVEPQSLIELTLATAYTAGDTSRLTASLLRRPQGGSIDTEVNSFPFDVHSTFDTGTVSIPTFALDDEPGPGTWEYRLKILVNISGASTISVQGTELSLQFKTRKR